MSKLSRHLGPLSVIAIACGAMMSGLLVLPGYAVKMTGASAYLAFLIAGLLFLPATLSKSEMSTAMPEAGGDYVFVDRSLGPLFSTISGVGMFVTFILKAAFALAGMAAYFLLLTPLSPSYGPFLAASVAGLLIALNYRGVKKAGTIQIFLVVLTGAVLCGFLLRGSTQIQSNLFSPFFADGKTGFLGTIALVFVSYAGVTKVASIAEEVKNPGQILPVGMLVSLLLMVCFYTLVVYIVVGTVPVSELVVNQYKNAPLARVGLQIMGTWGEWIMAGISVLALIAMANAGILASSRYPFALARKDQLPSIFERIHPRFSVPHWSLIATGGLLVGVILFLPVIQIAKLASAFKLLVLGFFNLALIILRESEIEWYQPEFRSPLYPYMQIVGIAGSVLLIGFLGLLPIVSSGGLILVGMAWYYFYVEDRVTRKGAMFQQPATQQEIEVFQKTRQQNLSDKESVIVPFFDLDGEDIVHVERRIRLGASLCDEDERLDVVDFIEVPDQASLGGEDSEPKEYRALKDRVRMIQHRIDCEINLDRIRTHHSRAALQSYAEDEDPHWVVFDWQKPSPWNFLLGINRWWLNDFPCDLLFFQDRDSPTFESILVLCEPGPYDGEIVYAADHIAEFTGGKITFLNPVESTDPSSQEFVSSYQQGLMDFCETPSTGEPIPMNDWVEEVVKRTQESDLLVVGGMSDNDRHGLDSQRNVKKIVNQASCSVSRVKSNFRYPQTIEKHTQNDLDLETFFRNQRGVQWIQPEDKEALFDSIAESLTSEIKGELDAQRIKGALWKRESIQNTFVRNGVAFPHGVLESCQRTIVVLFSLRSSVAYTDDGRTVDQCVVTLGPPDERRTHLRMISKIAALFKESNLKQKLLEVDGSEFKSDSNELEKIIG